MKNTSFNIINGKGPKVTIVEERDEELESLCKTQTMQRKGFAEEIILTVGSATQLAKKWNEICELRQVINEKFEEQRLLAVGQINERFLKAIDKMLEKLESTSTEELLTSDNFVLRQIGKRIQKG